MVDLQSIDDAKFPNILEMLDLDHVEEVLRKNLIGLIGDLEIIDVRMGDVRYKPGEEFAVQYKLRFSDDAAGRMIGQSVTLELPSAAFTERRQDTSNSDKYDQTAGTIIRCAEISLPELGAIAFPFPIDPYIPALIDALNGEYMKGWFNQLPHPRGRRVQRVKPRLISYTLGTRATILYELRYRDVQDGKLSYQKVIGKLSAAKSLAKELTNNWALWRASEGKFQQAEPIGTIQSLGLSLQTYVHGQRLGAMLEHPNFKCYLNSVAEALLALHSVNFPLPRRRDGARAVKSLRRRVKILKSARPDLAQDVRHLAAELEQAFLKHTCVYAPAHGDFHHTNVMVGEDGVSLIDFDELSLGDPALDVGRFIASLSIPSLRFFGDLRACDWAAKTFLQTYLAGAEIDLNRIRMFEAASYLTSAITAFRLQRQGWREHIQILLARSELTFRGIDFTSSAGQEMQEAPNEAGALSRDEKKIWAREANYIALLVKRQVIKLFSAEVFEGTLMTVRNYNSRLEYVYLLKGVRDEETWRFRTYGFIRASGNIARIYRDLELLQQNKKSLDQILELPLPIGRSGPIGLLIYLRRRGVSLTNTQKLDWCGSLPSRLAQALFVLHSLPVPLERRRTFDARLRGYIKNIAGENKQEILDRADRVNWDDNFNTVSLEKFNPRDFVDKDGLLSLVNPSALVCTPPWFAVAEIFLWLDRFVSNEAANEFRKAYLSAHGGGEEILDQFVEISALAAPDRQPVQSEQTDRSVNASGV